MTTIDPRLTPAARTTHRLVARAGILKKLLIALAILVLLLVILVLMTPWIASKIAPGIIESAANDSLKGSVKVESMSLGWSGPTIIGPVELRDETGKPVGRVRIEAPLGLWGAISLATGDMSNIDVGEVKVDGRLDVVRNADGTMNLTKAVEPRNPSATGSSSSSSSSGNSSPIDKIKAKLTVTDLDITYKDLSAPPNSPTAAIGVDSFAGSADIDYAAKAGSADVSGKFAGKVQSGSAVGTAGGDDLKLTALVKATGLPTAGGSSAPLNPNINADIGVTGVPVTLVDGLAGFGGELAASIGANADATIKVNGTRDNATAAVNLAAPGAGADLDLAYDGAAVTAVKPGKIWARSTQFITGLQAAKAPLADIGRSVKLDAAPGIDISLDALRVPLPKAALDKLDPKTLDLRGTQAKLTIKTDAIAGRVALDPPAKVAAPADGSPTPAPPAPTTVGPMKPFKVDPTTVQVTVDDLAKGASITTASKATIDGQNAGDLSVAIAAANLLDEQGRLRALNGQPVPDSLDANVTLKGLATALVSPVLSGLKLPVDLREDVGPTLDLAVVAKTTGPAPKPAPAGASAPAGAPAAGLAALPPMNVNANVTSQNIRLDAPVRVADGQVATVGKGVELAIGKAGPIARRILAEQAKAAPAGSKPMKLDGDVRVHATIKDFAAPLDPKQLDPVKLKGAVDITLEDAALTLPASPAADGKPAPSPAPIGAQKLTTRVTLGGPEGPHAIVNGALSHAGSPFTVDADLSAPGFAQQFPRAKNNSLADILAYRPTGRFNVRNVPASLTAMAPSLDAMLNTAPVQGDVKSQVYALIKSLVGKSVDTSITLTPRSDAENTVIALVTATGITTEINATLKPAEVALAKAVVTTPLKPGQLDGIFDAVMPGPAAVAAPAPGAAPVAGPAPRLGAPGSNSTPGPRLHEPVTLAVSVDPLTVPVKPNSFEPDFTKVQRLVARASASGPVILDNVPLGAKPDGSPKMESVGVKNLALTVDAAGGVLAGDKTAPVTLSADAIVLRSGQPIATMTSKTTASQDLTRPIDAAVNLTDVKFAALDAMVGSGDGLIPGVAGSTGVLSLTAKGVPDMKNPDLRVEVGGQTDRLEKFTLKLDAKQGALRLVEPGVIKAHADVAALNRALFAPAAGSTGGPGPALTGIGPIEIRLNQFAAAIPNAEQKTGPLKPGVFALDAGIAIPTLAVNTPVSSGPAGAPATMVPIALEGVRLTAKSADAGAMNLDAVIDKVTGQGASSNDKAALHASVRQIADASGNLTTANAILDANADVRGFPTILIDVLANQKGLLAETLGPTANLTATATQLSMGGGGGTGSGSLTARATSPRAEASVAGTMADKTFITTQPLDIKLVEITPKLVEQLAGALPLVATAEKTRQDEPATVKGEGLKVPLDGNLRKLNGRIAVTPGVMRYTTAGFFQKVLKLGELRDTGSVGKRLEPFVVNLKDGVASYDRFVLPVGEFKFETRGTIDLVSRQMDIITYVPLFAVTDEISGALNTGLGSVLGKVLPGGIDRATMIPIRTRGSMDNPKVEPDLQLFAKENAAALKDAPGKILDGTGLGKELEKIIPKDLPLPGLPKKEDAPKPKPPR